MTSIQQRQRERRQQKLEHIRRQVVDGSLVIRQMTVGERERYPATRSETTLTTFFIPELDPLEASAEDVYAGIREAAHEETGHPPQELRIFELWFRRDGVDVEAEVGKPDPIGGQTVLAILDLGRRWPYLVCCGRPGGQRHKSSSPSPSTW